jgi:hypothetical protein
MDFYTEHRAGGVGVAVARPAEWALRECAQPAGLRFTNA